MATRRRIGLDAQLFKVWRESELTAYGVAVKTNLAYSIVHAWTKGERGLTLASASRIADALGLALRPKQKGR